MVAQNGPWVACSPRAKRPQSGGAQNALYICQSEPVQSNELRPLALSRRGLLLAAIGSAVAASVMSAEPAAADGSSLCGNA